MLRPFLLHQDNVSTIIFDHATAVQSVSPSTSWSPFWTSFADNLGVCSLTLDRKFTFLLTMSS